jgi:hypothetical protein
MSNDNADNLPELTISPQDVLAAISFEAQRIVAAVQQHAAGYPFPSPKQIQEVIDRMIVLNHTLLANQAEIARANSAEVNSRAAMEVQLN